MGWDEMKLIYIESNYLISNQINWDEIREILWQRLLSYELQWRMYRKNKEKIIFFDLFLSVDGTKSNPV